MSGNDKPHVVESSHPGLQQNTRARALYGDLSHKFVRRFQESQVQIFSWPSSKPTGSQAQYYGVE